MEGNTANEGFQNSKTNSMLNVTCENEKKN